MLDRDSAEKLGDRKLGELADMVSQFEVADNYTQINYKGRPVRVTPLRYGDIFKWLNNRSAGLPAYLIIDMVTQEVDVVRLPEGRGAERMNEQLSLRRYRRDCLLGMLGGMLMLANAIWAGRQIKREEN